MAYLVVYNRGQIIARQALADEMTTIGRSPDCMLVVRDILLSRSHCRIDRAGDEWTVSDLHSKNGTIIDGSRIDKHTLRDGDTLRMGNTLIKFYIDEMPPALAEGARKPRPTDPIESLEGTVWGMTLESEPLDLPGRFANPRPAPPLPEAYEREKIHEMLEEIASSSWDSIYAESRKPVKRTETAATIDRPRQRPQHPGGVCLSLQVNADVLHSFRKHQRDKTKVRRRVNRVLRTAYRITPWIAMLGILKAA